MTPRLSGHFSIFGLVFFMLKYLLGIARQWSTAKERRLNQSGTAVLIWCGKNVKFHRVCRIIRHWSGR